MSGRDPHEHHRVATPLELLFDLTFVVAFGAAGNELAHALAEGHVASGLIGFGLAMFGTCWAWINFSWFASAYDTDDWAFRLLTMVQMAGVLIFALGLYELFISRIDVAEGSEFAARLLLIRNLDDLKDRLAKVVLLILVVKFFEYALALHVERSLDLLWLGLGIALVATAVLLSHGKPSHGKQA